MSNFWARWRPFSLGLDVREDTRIYWGSHTEATPPNGRCIGTFVGENPGGALPVAPLPFTGRSPLISRGRAGDPTLRLLLDVWKQAVLMKLRKTPLPQDTDYIEVLNLYYFRCTIAAAASPVTLHAWITHGGSTIYHQPVDSNSTFLLLGWSRWMNAYGGTGHFLPPLTRAIKMVIPDSRAFVLPPLTSATWPPLPLSPFPVSPSYMCYPSRRTHYINNVAFHL